MSRQAFYRFSVVALCGFLAASAAMAHRLAASSEDDRRVTALSVGQCREEAKDTSVNYQCERAAQVCEEDEDSITFNLGVSGGIVAVQAEGGISYETSVPKGCAVTGAIHKQQCLQMTGVTFTSYPGDVTEVRKHDCGGYNESPCIEDDVEIDIALPGGIIAALEEQFNVNLPDTVSVPVPATRCIGDGNNSTPKTCPGTNGGQTWYDVVDTTCFD